MYPPKDINNLISHVIYINLDSQGERRKHIEQQLSVFDPSKVTRLPGIIDKMPATGCAKSHLKALQLARENKYPNVFIVEDDAFWQNVDEAYPLLQRLISQPYDGIMLAAVNAHYDKDTLRISSGLTTHAYIVNQRFYDTLIKLFEEAIADEVLKPKNSAGSYVWADDVIRSSHKKGEWYITAPALMIQNL